jgi:hypothetical protein
MEKFKDCSKLARSATTTISGALRVTTVRLRVMAVAAIIDWGVVSE